tara:strand:- start:406 stop:612 length:207 start_codon:yes stop_codon:yes gene_type:complete
MLRQKCKVSPKSEKAKHIFATYLNSKSIVHIEHKRDHRWFLSAIDNPDYWFWVDYPNDINWNYTEIKQ